MKKEEERDDKPPKDRTIFYFATVGLLVGAVIVALIQKRYEGAIAMAGAKGGDAQGLLQCVWFCGVLSLAMVSLAILSCGIAIWRREKHRSEWASAVVLLSLYVLLELLMV